MSHLDGKSLEPQNDGENDSDLTPKDSASAQCRLQLAREIEPIRE